MNGWVPRLVSRAFAPLLLSALAIAAQVQSTQQVTRTLPTRLNPPATPPKPDPAEPRVIEHSVPQAHPPGTEIPDSILAWDAPVKEFTAKSGEVEARFTFNVTNVSSENVTIHGVSTSCGCTVAQLPSVPWVLGPGSNGQINATMNLAGKIGNITKAVTINSDKGPRTLLVRASIPTGLPRPNPGPIPLVGQRELNQKLAQADRQAVFKGDCAKCHVEPATSKSGHDLYVAACGICHDSPQRASTVPDLHHLTHETGPAFWRDWILHGKKETMMPAFGQAEGGPLTDSQVDSLVAYLAQTIPLQKAAGN